MESVDLAPNPGCTRRNKQRGDTVTPHGETLYVIVTSHHDARTAHHPHTGILASTKEIFWSDSAPDLLSLKAALIATPARREFLEKEFPDGYDVETVATGEEIQTKIRTRMIKDGFFLRGT